MSTTFRIEGIDEETGHDLPCPACGESLQSASAMAEHPDCDTCSGYGGPETLPVPQFQLNLANVNAARLLVRLGLDGGDALCGSASAADVLVKLELAKPAPGEERYFEQLRKIATKARKYERAVLWD